MGSPVAALSLDVLRVLLLQDGDLPDECRSSQHRVVAGCLVADSGDLAIMEDPEAVGEILLLAELETSRQLRERHVSSLY